MALMWSSILLTQEFTIPALVFLSVFLLSYQWLIHRKRDKRTKFSGPPPLPIIGSSYYFFNQNLQDTLKLTHKMCGTYGPVFSFWFGPVQLIVASSVGINEKVLTTRSIRNRGPYFDKVAGDVLLKGILLASNEGWRNHRKILASTLHNNVLQHYVKTFAGKAKDVAEKLLAGADGSAVDIHMLFIQCSMNIICETMMGTAFSAVLTKDMKFITVMLKLINGFGEKVKKPWMMIDWVYKRSQLGKESQKAVKYFHGRLREVISEKKRLLEASNMKKLDLEDRESVQRRDLSFIDLLLMDGQMTEEDILGECASIVGAGSDTVSWSTCYVLTLLAEHSDVQERVMQEQTEIFHSDDFQRPVTPEDLNRMLYLEQVIKETLRLYTPVPFVLRHVDIDTDIGDGKRAPAGSHIILFTLKVHRDPRHFPEPLKFNPDRFATENEGNRHPYAYIPFGGGQRMCLGYKLAMLEMKSIISTVLRHVTITEAVTDMAILEENFLFGIVMKPGIPIRLRFMPRSVN